MKKNSANSLKRWLSKIRRYEYELPLLYEKLEYLKIRSIGYNSPCFEPRYSSKIQSNRSNIEYWMEKINDCEIKIQNIEKEIDLFHEFSSSLNDIENEIVKQLLIYCSPKIIIATNNLNRSNYYAHIRNINMKIARLNSQ